MNEKQRKEIEPFLEANGKVRQLPVKAAKQKLVLLYLWEQFEAGRDYREKEINHILDQWHTFGDFYLLRRTLVDGGYLGRLNDGSRYWRCELAEAGEGK